MQLKTLIDNIHERCRKARPGITKADVTAVIKELGAVIQDDVVLKADRVNLPGFGCAHATWLGNGKKSLYAQFDWAEGVENRIREVNQ